MSLFFRDPFFDDFDSYLVRYPYCGKKCNCKEEDAMVNPASGFGRMDVVESDKEYDIMLDLPGMKKEELKTTIENNRLVVEGERKSEKKTDNKKCHISERSFGSFHREVALPENVDTETVNAVYENGELKITFPKKEVTSGKKCITVN